jgi:multicomponent K+:H+ antiporter subunit A
VLLPSATFFDLGVFSLVLGSTLFILVALAHQSVRAHREAEAERREDPAPRQAEED